MSRFPVFVIKMGKMTKLRQNCKLPCGTKFLLVLIFAIFPAIHGKNKLPINWNFLKHLPEKIHCRVMHQSIPAAPSLPPGYYGAFARLVSPGGGAFAGCGFYGYRLKFWLFYGYRLIFFQLRLTKKLIIYFFCFKGLNINQRVFFVSFKQNKGLRIISGWNKLLFWEILTFDRSYFL